MPQTNMTPINPTQTLVNNANSAIWGAAIPNQSFAPVIDPLTWLITAATNAIPTTPPAWPTAPNPTIIVNPVNTPEVPAPIRFVDTTAPTWPVAPVPTTFPAGTPGTAPKSATWTVAWNSATAPTTTPTTTPVVDNWTTADDLVSYFPTYTSWGYILYTKAGGTAPSYAKDKDGNKISLNDLKTKIQTNPELFKKIDRNAYNWLYTTNTVVAPTTTWTTTTTSTGVPTAGAAVTGDKKADKAATDLKTYNDNLNKWLWENLSVNIQWWQDAVSRIDDANLRQQTLDRITQVNNWFQAASKFITDGSELATKAQAIYNNDNIRSMRESLIARWFSSAKAGPAVMAKAMKDKAILSANIMNLQADYNKTLANLETQRTQLEDTVRASWIENDKWVIDRKNEITRQIQDLRTSFENNVIKNNDRYILQPQIDVFSWNFQAELQNIAKQKEIEFANSSPEAKIFQAAKTFWADWAYVSPAVVAQSTSLPFGTFLTKAWESIKNNKIAAQNAVK